VIAYASSLDQVGPVTRDVTDCAVMLGAVAGYDPCDSTSVNMPVPDYTKSLVCDVKGVKIGLPKECFTGGLEPDVQKTMENAIDTYRNLGVEFREISLPTLDYAVAAYYLIATAEASSNLARYDGVHYGHRTKDPKDYIEVYTKSRAEAFGEEVKRRIMLGTYALSSGYYDAYYLKALKVRNLIRGDFTKAFEKCDCVMMPVAPTTAFKIGEKVNDPLQMYLSDIYTIAANLAGIPGISIPCGFDDKNLPIGLQILTPTFTEDKLLRIARMYESQTNWNTRTPPIISK